MNTCLRRKGLPNARAIRASLIVGIVLALSAPAYAVRDGHVRTLSSCEEAVTLGRVTRTWLKKIPAKPSRNERIYERIVKYSPTCFWRKTAGGGHFTIYQLGKGGYFKELVGHKAGAQEWVYENWGLIKRECTRFFDQAPIEYLRWQKPRKNGAVFCALIRASDAGGYHMGGAPAKGAKK